MPKGESVIEGDDMDAKRLKEMAKAARWDLENWFILLVAAVFWFGVGALMHWILIGPQLDWSSAATIGVIIGWPVLIVVAYGLIVLVLFLFTAMAALVVAIKERL